MACYLSDIDQVLNAIFDSCAENGNDQAPVYKLASILSQKYATDTDDQNSLREIISEHISQSAENHYVCRSVFLSQFKLWIRGRDSPRAQDSTFNLSNSEFNCGHLGTSTPNSLNLNTAFLANRKFDDDIIETQSLFSSNSSSKEDSTNRSNDKKSLMDRTHLLENSLIERSMSIQKLMKKNISLESRLSTFERVNQSLDLKIDKMSFEYNQKIKRFMEEQVNYTNIIGELQEKLKEKEDKINDLSSVNIRMKNESDNCHCKQLEEKYCDLQQEVENLRSTSSSSKDKEVLINFLEHELGKHKDGEHSLIKINSLLTKENESLLSSQEELISTIGELRMEKRNLQEKVNELMEKQVMFPDTSSGSHDENYQDDDQRESGISLRFSLPFACMVPESLDEIFSDSNKRKKFLNNSAQTDESRMNEVSQRQKFVNNSAQTDESRMNEVSQRLTFVNNSAQTDESRINEVSQRLTFVNNSAQTDESRMNEVSQRQKFVNNSAQTDESRMNEVSQRQKFVNNSAQTDEPRMYEVSQSPDGW